MKRSINFGKVDYCGTGSAENLVTLVIELRAEKEKPVFSVCGIVWNRSHSDIVSGGQNLDDVAEHIKTPLFKEIYSFWKKYHLNDLHAACEHQAALGWEDKSTTEVELYTFCMTSETLSRKRHLTDSIMGKIKNGETFQATKEEQHLLCLEYSFEHYNKNLDPSKSGFYELDKTEVKTLGWLYEKQHPDGLLRRPCPVCGYKYGTAWHYRAIPETDLNRIKEIIETGK